MFINIVESPMTSHYNNEKKNENLDDSLNEYRLNKECKHGYLA
jgi:hypothetical protein